MALCPALSNSLFTSYQLKLMIPTENKSYPAKLTRGIICCSNSNSSFSTTTTTNLGPPVIKKRKRYRKPYPGEKKGITEEMRFVAMRLRNLKGKYTCKSMNIDDDDDDSQNSQDEEKENSGEGDGESWVPSMEGFIRYLVDSKLVFDTVERIVDKSDDVSYTHFRRSGLERSGCLAKDLEWFRQQDIAIPEPTTPAVSYAKYLEDLAEKNAPLFLCHFYNIYFSHIAGGQVIAAQVSEKLLEGRVLEFYRWGGDVQELLKRTRDKLNMLGKVDCLGGLVYLICLCICFHWDLSSHFSNTKNAALVSRCEKQMFKRSNKVLQVFGADSPINHLIKQSCFHTQWFWELCPGITDHGVKEALLFLDMEQSCSR